jgi:predicted nucleic acid-binding protein
MKILFDTNVILDVLLEREPFAKPAAYLMSKVETSEIQGYISAITVTTIHYLIAKAIGKTKAKKYIKLILSLFEVAPVNRLVLESSLSNKFTDYEDAVIYESAIHAGVECIVTRDVKDYKPSVIPVYEPLEMVNIILNLRDHS